AKDDLQVVVAPKCAEIAAIDLSKHSTVANLLVQRFGCGPVHGIEPPGNEAFVVPLEMVDDEKPLRTQDPMHFPYHSSKIEGMVERVRVHRVDGAFGKGDAVEIPVQNHLVVRTRVEIDSDRQMSQAVQRLDLGANPRSQTQHRAHLAQSRTFGESAAEFGQ